MQANPALAEPLRIAGVEYREMTLSSRDLEKHLTSQLSWWNYM